MRLNYAFLFDVLLRILAALALSIFAYRVAGQWAASPLRLVLALLLVSQCLNVGLALLARQPRQRDWRPFNVVLTLVALFYFLALDLSPGMRLIPAWWGVILQCMGIAWQIYAKLSIGRAFGLLPADRGIVTSGAYQWVRHPIYMGYFVDHMGFLLASFNLHNLIVLTGLYVVQAVRVFQEERLLLQQPQYRDYCEKVRFRFIPSVF